MGGHVIFKEFYLGESVTTNIAYMLLLVLCVVSFHMQCQILLPIELFPTFVTGIVKVCTMAHFLVFQQLCFSFIALGTLAAIVRLVRAVDVLNVIVEPRVARKDFGADVAHEAF